MVMAQSLFITLKQQHPDNLIDVVAPGWSVPLLQRMPQVNKAIELPVGHKQLGLMARYQTGKRLRARHYDRAIVLPRSFKSALVPFFARARRRTGYRGEQRYGLINDMRRLDRQLLRQTVQRYVALGLSEAPTQPPPVPYPQLRIDTGNRLHAGCGIRTRQAMACELIPGTCAKAWRSGYAGLDLWFGERGGPGRANPRPESGSHEPVRKNLAGGRGGPDRPDRE
jgi:lipopolysaccharide heptosyltransferase II